MEETFDLMKEEYINWFVTQSMMTREFYNQYFETLPCQCGETDCRGYRAIRKDKLKEYQEKCVGGIFYG